MLHRLFPVFEWGRGYDRETFTSDLVAAIVVTIMLVPQGMAYAMLAGLPPQVGLYGAMLPLVIYALLGSSRQLAVGPVAVVALMTAAAAGEVAAQGTQDYHLAALVIAFLSGAILLALGLLRLGFLANFLSHPVISGFITAAGILIAGSQLRHLTGIDMGGSTLPALVASLVAGIGGLHLPTVALSTVVLAFLFWARSGLAPLMRRIGIGAQIATLVARGALLMAVAISTAAVAALGLDAAGVAIVGEIPRGMPALSLPLAEPGAMTALLVPALMIAIVGYVESVSIAQTLAARRRQKIDVDRELVALGAANLGASATSAMPVTGGLSRSIVNFDAGARTPAAGAMTAVGVGLALLVFTPLMHFLPRATLAAIIIVAVASLLDLRALPRIWSYSRADGAAMAATIAVTLGMGVEPGLAAGVGLSLLLHLYRTSRPHVAVVGQVPGTEHFRNVERHAVVTDPEILSIRIDESLYFPNARFLEDCVMDHVAGNPRLRHVVLMFPAVNDVDASALESLETINRMLADSDVQMHLSEVKGPVMDRLQRSHFLEALTGEVYLTQFDAVQALAPDLAACTRRAARHETTHAPT